MGTDIHFYAECKKDHGWQLAGIYNIERNYTLFSILADVRNRQRINCIDKPRGIPEDCSEVMKEIIENRENSIHSCSYLTVQELINFDWTQTTRFNGFVGEKSYVEWKLIGYPNHWSECSNSEIISNEEMEKRIGLSINWKLLRDTSANLRIFSDYYTKVSWDSPYYNSCGDFLGVILPKLWRLGSLTEVRCVFFFDS